MHNAIDFGQIFVHRGPQAGQQTAFCLSPNGGLLLSATNTGSILLIDTYVGHVQVYIDTGATDPITALVWMNDNQAIFSRNDGNLFMITFRFAIKGTLPAVSITHVLQELVSAVCALGYDYAHRLLVVGYETAAFIWRMSSDGANFRLLDQVVICGGGARRTKVNAIQFFGQPEQRLFVGGSFGYFIWSGPKQSVFHKSGAASHGVGNAVVSPNGRLLSVSTLDQAVLIWQLTAHGPNPNPSLYRLTTGDNYYRLKQRTPIAITSSNLTISGSQVGQMALISSTGELVHDFFFESNLTVQGILAFDDRIYVSFNGPVDSVIIVGYSNRGNQCRTIQKLQIENQKKLSNMLRVKIDLREVLKVSPRRRLQQVILNSNTDPADSRPRQAHLVTALLFATLLAILCGYWGFSPFYYTTTGLVGGTEQAGNQVCTFVDNALARKLCGLIEYHARRMVLVLFSISEQFITVVSQLVFASISH